LLIRNLPRRYGGEDLLREVESVVGTGLIDFLHVPLEGAARNKAFGVINFVDPGVASAAHDMLQGRLWRHAERAKPARVLVADVQGLSPNIARAAHVVGSKEAAAMPLIFLSGARPIEFEDALRVVKGGGALIESKQRSPTQAKPGAARLAQQELRLRCQGGQHWHPTAVAPPTLIVQAPSQGLAGAHSMLPDKPQRQPGAGVEERTPLRRVGQQSPSSLHAGEHDDLEKERPSQAAQQVRQLRQLQLLLRARLQHLSQHQRPRRWAPWPADEPSLVAASRDAWEAYSEMSRSASARDAMSALVDRNGDAEQPVEQVVTDAGAPSPALKEAAGLGQSFSTDSGRFAEEPSDVDDLNEPRYVSVSFEMPIVQEFPHRGERADLGSEASVNQRDDCEGLSPEEGVDARLGRNPGYRKALQDFQAQLKAFIRRHCATGGAAPRYAAAA